MTSRKAPLIAIVAALLFASGPVQAQSEAARADARARIAEGRTAYERGDYEGALKKFQAAFAVFPSPKIHFNIAQAYRGLARDAEAFDALQRFLAEAGDASPALRKEAEQNLAELRLRVATIEVACDTPGAEVSIDGRSYGLTPLPSPIVVSPGFHQVLVQKAGLLVYTERVEPRAATTLKVSARIAPARPAPPPTPIAALTSAPPPSSPRSNPPDSRPGTDLTARATPAHEEGTGRPFYVRWWFWTAVGVAAAGGATAIVLATRNRGPDNDICDCDLSPGVVSVPTH